MMPRWTDPVRIIGRFPRLHSLFHRRGAMEACVVCRYVWSRLLDEPGFSAALDEGIRDLDAGNSSLYEVRDGGLFRVDES